MRIVDKHVVYGDKEYTRTAHNGYYVLTQVVDGKLDDSTRIPEHRVVYEVEHGVALPDNIHIHHLNRNRMDNRPQNLIALTSSDHARLHYYEDMAGYNDDKSHDEHVLPIDRVSSIPKDILERFVAFDGQVYYRSIDNGGYMISPIVDGAVDKSKTVSEHRFVYEHANNTVLPKGVRVYHINGNRFDNRPENLIAANREDCMLLRSGASECGVVVTKDKLEELIETNTNREIGEMYGVTSTAVAAWRKKLCLPSASEQRRSGGVEPVTD